MFDINIILVTNVKSVDIHVCRVFSEYCIELCLRIRTYSQNLIFFSISFLFDLT